MKNLRTDPMWDELKYKLTHPETDEEQRARAIKEKTYRESMLKRIFSDKEDGSITGGAAPIGAKEYWDKNGKVYWGDSNGNRLPDTKNYVEKFTNKAKAIASNVSDFINETNPNHPSYKQKTNVLVSSAMLPYMPETMLSKAVASKLAPNAGRKIAQSIAQGINGGAISGAFEGTIRSIQEQKNPIKTIAQDSALGAVGGAVGGAAGSNVQKVIRGQNLKKINFNNYIEKQDLKSIRNIAKNYYNDYIKGTSIYKDDIGKIQFGDAGVDEVISKGLQNIKTFPNLKYQIKNGILKPSTYDHPRQDIRKFDIVENVLDGKSYEYQIADDVATGKKFYFAKDISNKKNLPSTDRNQYPGSKVDSPTIIKDFVPKLKSFSEWIKELRRNRGD